ncbi:MAG: NMT1/THI5-like protein [Evtepia sp.]|nr:NMT1/THI5-like protein [Evtepia sp.]
MKKLVSLCLIALLSLSLLSGCGKTPKQEGGTENPKELQTIVFTEPVRGYFWAPAYLAQTLGYFEEAGLKAEFQTVSGADASAPVFSGDAQFGLRGVEMALMASEAGQNCKILVSTTSHYPYQLIGANKNYSTIESLRGKVIAGGQGPTSAPQAFSKAILTHAGMVPDQDASIISMASSGYIAAMKSGDIQAAVATNPWATKSLLANGGVLIVDGGNEAALKDLMGSSTYELFMVFATDQYIKENPETVQKVVTAIAKATKWMESATPEEIATKLDPLFEGKHDELLYSAQVDKQSKFLNTTGRYTDSGYAAALNLTKLSGGITKDIPAAAIYDETFLDKAWEEIGK